MAVTTSITHLNPGDKAPAFKVYDQYGELFSPQDYKGKKVALFFYPNDDTKPAQMKPVIFVIIMHCYRKMDMKL